MDTIQIAKIAHETYRGYCDLLGEVLELPWSDMNGPQKQNATNLVEFYMSNPQSEIVGKNIRESMFKSISAQLEPVWDNPVQIARKEIYNITIGEKDFGDFVLESEWECCKKLTHKDSNSSVIVYENIFEGRNLLSANNEIWEALRAVQPPIEKTAIDLSQV